MAVLAPAIPYIMAASAVVGGVSAYQSGQSQKKAMKYNAEMEELKATDALQRGASEAAAKRDRARKIAASQAEGMAMSGVSIDTGTPLDLIVETAGLGEMDALTTLNNAQRQSWGHQGQSELDRYRGRAAGRTGVLNAGATFLGGASNAYFGYRATTPKT